MEYPAALTLKDEIISCHPNAPDHYDYDVVHTERQM
jgi:hypothetical protein